MLSLPLLKKNFKENDRLWLLSAGILTVFTLLMVGMYDPSLEEHLRALAASLPEAVQGALGIQVVENSMTGFLSAYLFGFLFLALPLIYEIVLARRLVDRLVKKGTMAYLLNTVVSRKKLIITQGYYLAVSLFALFFYGAALGGLSVWLVFPEEMELSTFFLLYVGAFCLHFFLSGLCFAVSCISSRDQQYLLLGILLPLLFYLFYMLSRASDALFFLGYLTPFSLFDVGLILSGSIHLVWMLPLLAVGGAALYGLGIFLFRRRELNI